jgi:nucleoside-diphosphate-sugar epimerase
MKLLISGTGSGLGKHLIDTLGGTPWNRQEATCGERNPEVIIHTAWPARPPVNTVGLAEHLENTLQLTRRLTEWPHRKFIFISTSEVYPLSGHSGQENEPVELAAVRNFYGLCKLMAESLVQARCSNFLILRSTGLLGPTARSSSLIRILREESPALTLTPQSRFSYLLHSQASAFIRRAIEQDLTGIYNLASNDSITLGEVAQRLGRRVAWGNYTYEVGPITNQKIAAIFPAFRKSSWEVIEQFIADSRAAGT